MWILHKISIMPTVRHFFVCLKDFNSWDTKIHGPCNHLRSFYVDALIDEYGTTKNYPLAMFRNGIPKIRDHLLYA